MVLSSDNTLENRAIVEIYHYYMAIVWKLDKWILFISPK